MAHTKYFTIIVHKGNPYFKGAMAQSEITVSENMTVLDLKESTGSSGIMKRDLSKLHDLNFNEVSWGDSLIPGEEYELINLDNEKLIDFIEQTRTITKNYGRKIPNTHYLMPPEGREKYPSLLEELVKKLHE